MDWISGIQKAINYIEDHLLEEIDYEEVAAQSFSSSYHFQRVFSILCGFTMGEYIRNRRLSLAGLELTESEAKIIDIASKYGYESPDSFARAFRKFHGINPSAVHAGGASLKSFSRLVLKISLEGGSVMNYRIEEKPEMIFTGYKRRFTGTPADRADQEAEFFMATRANQFMLKGLAHDCETTYSIMKNFDDEGYDFYIAGLADPWMTEHLQESLGEDAKRFEKIVVPAGKYLVCETEKRKFPTEEIENLRMKMVSEWLPASGYELSDTPEIEVSHWFFKYNDNEVKSTRYIELWLPIK